MNESGPAARKRMLDEMLPLVEQAGLSAVGHDMLIGIYNRAGRKTIGSIIIPENNREDEFQGKVGIILDIGPACFGAKYDAWFGDKKPKPQVGDFFGINTRDSMAYLLGSHTVRSVEWQYLRFRVEVPDMVM